MLTAELDAVRAAGRWLPGPATTLEVIGRSGLESDHERLIAWLLDPLAAHNLGPAVLGAVIERLADTGPAPRDDLFRARVRRQVAGAGSRPDIVVTMPGRTLVIELKISSEERPGQTARQADDYADDPNAVLLFLTFRGRRPNDRRFLHLSLREFAEDLRRILSSVEDPASPVAVRGRAVAADYLATLERMLGLDPADQEAARFWLIHGKNILQAKAAARRLLGHLPEYVCTALQPLAAELDENLVVSSFEYEARSAAGSPYPERAALLARTSWMRDGDHARAGIGLGQSTTPDPHSDMHRPFWGIYAADQEALARLRESLKPGAAPWHPWAWWQYVDLEPPDNQNDLLTHYAAAIAERARLSWKKNVGILDQAMEKAGY